MSDPVLFGTLGLGPPLGDAPPCAAGLVAKAPRNGAPLHLRLALPPAGGPVALLRGAALRPGAVCGQALYMADAEAWPTVKTRHQLGTVFHQQGRHDEALREFNGSLMILDDNALTDHCIAQIYIESESSDRWMWVAKREVLAGFWESKSH